MQDRQFTPDEIRQTIYTVVFEVSGIEVSELRPELSISDDLVPSSLDRVTLLMALEDEFSRSIPEEELKDIHTLGDLVNFVQEKYRVLSSA